MFHPARFNEIQVGSGCRSSVFDVYSFKERFCPFDGSVQLALIHVKLSVFAIIRKVNLRHDTLYRASLVCSKVFFALFSRCFPATFAPLFDLYLACLFLLSLATGKRLKFIWYVANGFILRPPLKRLRRPLRAFF